MRKYTQVTLKSTFGYGNLLKHIAFKTEHFITTCTVRPLILFLWFDNVGPHKKSQSVSLYLEQLLYLQHAIIRND